MLDYDERLRRLEELLGNIVRTGIVSATNPTNGTVRVTFPDRDNLVSNPLPVLYPKTHADKVYHMPDVGEQVLCVFLPSGVEQGFVVGSMYSTSDATPAASQTKHVVEYKDGTREEFDTSSSTKKTTVGTTEVLQDANQVVIKAGAVQAVISASGLAVTGGTVTHNGTNIGDTHVHGGVEPGGSSTSVPQ